jgi:DNA excision repair protein ERCC-2
VNFDLDRRRARMSVGDLSDFSIGPRSSAGGQGGLWRAQLGSRWHRELQAQAVSEGADAEFEVPIEGEIARKGWLVALAGRIDQVVRVGGTTVLREIKTVTRALPSSEAELRADYPGYFVQLATYAALRGAREKCELVFVEADTGLAQTVGLSPADERLLDAQLDRVAEFLDLRLQGRERLRQLRFRPAFAVLRHGQEVAATQLRDAVRGARSAILLEAPTGFGKTGVLLECALGELREGNFERVLYLTGKSTGQLEVVETLRDMTAPGPDLGAGAPWRPGTCATSPSTASIRSSNACGRRAPTWTAPKSGGREAACPGFT